ncbi:MAG: hypothetical protein K2L67_06155 [Clostridia bacterium]|nr:hypothetical protein [Clostridia bacterium]
MNLWKWWHKEKQIFGHSITGANLTKNAAMYFFIILSALISRTSFIAAAIFAAIAYIFAEFRHICPFNADEKSFSTKDYYLSAKDIFKRDLKKLTKKHIKNIAKFLIPVAIVLTVALIVLNFLDTHNFEQSFFLATAIVAIILVVPIFLERSFIDLSDDYSFDFFTAKYLLEYHETSREQKLKLKLLMYSSCVLVAAGLALSFCLDIFYAVFIIIGCVIHLILKSTERKYSSTCPLKKEYCSQSEASPTTQSNESGSSEKMLYDSEVLRLVQKIADRWSYKSDYLVWGSSEKINYKVSVEISGYSNIFYTVGGKLENVRDDDVSNALNFASAKIDNTSVKIKQETEQELSKHNLPQSNYMIVVYKGSIERR